MLLFILLSGPDLAHYVRRREQQPATGGGDPPGSKDTTRHRTWAKVWAGCGDFSGSPRAARTPAAMYLLMFMILYSYTIYYIDIAIGIAIYSFGTLGPKGFEEDIRQARYAGPGLHVSSVTLLAQAHPNSRPPPSPATFFVWSGRIRVCGWAGGRAGREARCLTPGGPGGQGVG